MKVSISPDRVACLPIARPIVHFSLLTAVPTWYLDRWTL